MIVNSKLILKSKKKMINKIKGLKKLRNKVLTAQNLKYLM